MDATLINQQPAPSPFSVDLVTWRIEGDGIYCTQGGCRARVARRDLKWVEFRAAGQHHLDVTHPHPEGVGGAGNVVTIGDHCARQRRGYPVIQLRSRG